MNLKDSLLTISGKIGGIQYTPFLGSPTKLTFTMEELESALSNGIFTIGASELQEFHVSRWVSPKRTRSYPFARVYDTLGSALRKVTVIPIVKDEGAEGDRDFLQWDTVSWMSLLNVYVIIGYYVSASKSRKYQNKITNQQFDACHLKNQFSDLRNFHSPAVHWNEVQLEQLGSLGRIALDQYEQISTQLNVLMHSYDSGIRRIEGTIKNALDLQEVSRNLARRAQRSESTTIHAAEDASWNKGKLNIQNHLGGMYHLTADQVRVDGSTLELIEVKHSRKSLPSMNDIKDALVKLILFTNLEDVSIEERKYSVRPKLKLTTNVALDKDIISKGQQTLLDTLVNKEAVQNNFSVEICHLP